MPKVSVLMPIYKTNPIYLKNAIQSILDQTFTDFELIILDDCPNNDRKKIVLSFNDKRIRYFKNKENIGITPSRNKLIRMAHGEYLAVMDHDDIALPDRLKEQVRLLDMNPQIGVVGCWIERFPNTKIVRLPQNNSSIEQYLMQGCAIAHTAAVIRKNILPTKPYEKQFTPAEDYALWCRLIGQTQFYNIPKVLMKYRWHDNNTSKIQSQKMKKATRIIRNRVRTKHPEIWNDVCQKAPHSIRLKLFGFIPIGKFIQSGNTPCKILKYLPFIKTKIKLKVVSE